MGVLEGRIYFIIGLMFDITIIGAGITGSLIAHKLSKFDLKVLVLEKENDVAEGATGANSAMVHSGHDPKPGTLKCRYNLLGNRMYPDLCKELQVSYVPIGAFVAALTIGGVLILLDKAWGFGTTELAAPQATLMKMIVEGVMDGNLPWTLVFIGIFTAVVVEILGIPVLPVAIGLYLPLELSTTIMLGGIIRWFADKKSKSKNDEAGSGVLFCSGMIAGEGLVGIILAVLAVIGIDSKINFSGSINLGTIGGIILLAVMIGCVAYFAMQKKAVNTKEKEKSEE